MGKGVEAWDELTCIEKYYYRKEGVKEMKEKERKKYESTTKTNKKKLLK